MIPKKIKIGAQDWTVAERSSGEDSALYEGVFGYTLETSNLIVIDKNLPPSRKRQTLFHELFHAVRFSASSANIRPNMEDVQNSEVINVWEHYFIAIYEDSFLAMLRDNPALAKFLLNKEPEK
jgi:hypothetical protein